MTTTHSGSLLLKLVPQLASMQIVLASASPRRQQLLTSLGIKYSIHQSRFAEDLDKSQYVGREYQYTIDTAYRKAIDVAQLLSDQQLTYDLIIACDTIVCLDNRILEKPTDAADAELMLTSARQHIVYTGVALIQPSPSPPVLFYESAKVTFGQLQPNLIRAYVESGEPLDKAGAYGIQGSGALLVDRVDGDFYTIVGMPLHRLSIELQNMLCE